MAGVKFRVNTGEVALVAATKKTIVQLIAASNHRVHVKEWGVSADGSTNAAEPIVVQLLRQTTAGTMTAISAGSGLNKECPGDGETIQATAAKNASAEPTDGEVIDQVELHPQGGLFRWQCPWGEPITVPGGTRLAIACTAPDGVNVIGNLRCEE